MNVTSENDQFQILLEPAATCTASTRSDEIPEKFHPPSTYIQISKTQVWNIFSKSVIVIMLL